ncbi:MAG: hypothetical protein J2P19_29860, partial [Pseudonocardia sp.]|nr:hypothetical protein [Pseudonocardia sp.]
MAATPRVGLRSEYPVDAARSHAIHDALSPVLAETRRLTGADIGLAAYQPGTDPGECVVLASSTAGGLDAPLPSEPVRFERPLPRRVPRLC